MKFGAPLMPVTPTLSALIAGSKATVYSLRLKIESKEPTIVRKETGSENKPKLKNAQGARPWMLNRGCC